MRAGGDRSDGPRRVSRKLLARVIVTLVATVVAGLVGLVRKPANEHIALAPSGHIVVLLDQQNVSAEVNVAEGPTPLYGLGVPRDAAKATNYISVEVQNPVSTTHPTNRTGMYHWQLLLENFPRLVFPVDTGLDAIPTEVREVQRRPQTTPFSDELKPNYGTHSYLLSQTSNRSSASFTFGAPFLAFRKEGEYADISIPPVEGHGVLIGVGTHGLKVLFNPTLAYSNVPARGPAYPVAPSSVRDFLDFPTGIDADDYSTVTGVQPTARNGSEWQWDDQEPHVLLRSTTAENNDANHLFTSGIWFGIAGAAAIAWLLELVELVAAFRSRAKAEDSPAD